MNSEWQVFRLGEVTSCSSGSTPSKQNPKFWGGDVPWVSAKDMKTFYLYGSEDGITEEALSEGAKIAPKGAVLVLTRGMTLLNDVPVCLLKSDSSFNQDVKAFQSRDPVLVSEYLPYLLLGHKSELQSLVDLAGHGTGRLATDLLLALEISLPSPREQKAIAHLLGSLDDKIELNRKTNETLEAMAKALFQSWFVDFDPVRAKAEGRPTGLPEEISDLFPDSFEESELGEIPRGWEVQTVAAVSSAIFDGPHATPAESDTGNVFLGIKNMTGTRISLEEIRLIHDDEWKTWTRRVAPQPHDIVFTYEAALGLFAIIPPKLKCCLGRRMALIRPLLENGCPHFWFHQFIASPFQRIINERSIHGATVNRTPLTEFPDYPVLTPPLPLRGHFEDVATGLWAKIHALSDQSRTLVPLRDTLLPKLISGELRIPEAEKLLEQAGV